ncbi:MAG: response regulator [Chitinophagaceae bacterium]
MAQAEPIKVFIADRYSHFRDNLKDIFKKKSIEVTGETETFEDLAEQVLIKRPDLIITAHRLSDKSAEYFLPVLKNRFPDVKVLMLTLNCSKKVFLEHAEYLDGMLCKMAHKNELLEAINEIVAKNKLYVRINQEAEEIRDQRQNRIR